MGANVDDNLDYSTQAALEVESLLDLAVSRFNSANITYHYRSQNEELIDFSNKAFYNNTLQIAPNISKNIKQKPIERILVNGKWLDRKNPTEAQKVVDSFNGKTMRIFDTDDDLGYNDYKVKLDVKMGERLNITTADYKTASADTPVEQARTLRYSAELV